MRRDLKSDYPQDALLTEGLKIHTTLDPQIQRILTQSAQQTLDTIEASRQLTPNSLQVAAVIVRTDNGEVVAMMGDRSARYGGFNRALDAQRSVGSLIKPFVYLTALEDPANYSLASVVEDKSITVEQAGSPPWTPENYDQREHGDVMLITALARSYNLAAVRTGMKIGLDEVGRTIDRLGFSLPEPLLPSLLLGAVPASVMDMATLYLPLAADGFKLPVRSVRSVLAKEGEGVGRYPLNIEQVVEPEFNYLINAAMQDTMRNGTGRNALRAFEFDYNLGGKTGTSDSYRDSWFAGYSGNYLMVVWVGRDDNQPTGLSGASGAGRIWANVMSQLPLTRLTNAVPNEIKMETVRYASQPYGECDSTKPLPVHEASLPLALHPCEDNGARPTQKRTLWNRLFGD